MAEFSMADRRYSYIRCCNWPSEAIDVHHIVVRKSNAKGFFNASISIFFWSFLLIAILLKLMFWKPVVKAFGVQLETHYRSGRIVRRFVPIDKILKPVLVECVIPMTCYWSLSLILHGEAELMLVFKELRPPVKMLVPIWKALSIASSSEENSKYAQ